MVEIDKVKIGDKLKYNKGSLRNQVASVIGFTRLYEGIKFITDSGYESHCYPSSFDYVEQPEQPKDQPMKISMDKQYLTRDGREVRILCVDRDHQDYPVVALIGDGIESFTAVGSYRAHSEDDSELDLIEYNPAQDLKLDQVIWVRNYLEGKWYPRHFAGLDNWGNVQVWNDGRTSFTATVEYNKLSWNYWTTTKPE